MAGLVGSSLGLLLGILFARAMTGYIGALLGDVFGIAQKAKKFPPTQAPDFRGCPGCDYQCCCRHTSRRGTQPAWIRYRLYKKAATSI